ncbi:hypothetical protein VTI28DRAFT_10243 [Corynascus sepedonium]
MGMGRVAKQIRAFGCKKWIYTAFSVLSPCHPCPKCRVWLAPAAPVFRSWQPGLCVSKLSPLPSFQTSPASPPPKRQASKKVTARFPGFLPPSLPFPNSPSSPLFFSLNSCVNVLPSSPIVLFLCLRLSCGKGFLLSWTGCGFTVARRACIGVCLYLHGRQVLFWRSNILLETNTRA